MELRELVKKIREGNLGFRIDEVMAGEHEFEAGFGPPGKRPMEFRATWGPDSIAQWIRPSSGRFLWQEMDGEVSMDGLCHRAPMKGTLDLRYFDEKRLRYRFEFEAGGQSYLYVGEKVNIRPWNLPTSHTTCYGRCTEKESGRLVSTSVTFFHVRRMPEFVASLRLV